MILRGNSSTSDFFLDGVRDDVEYFRDFYNIDRVEILKGPNAMIFGRGGAGGIVNRVTRQADWQAVRELSLQGGSWDNRRATVDVGDAVNDRVALRITGLYEDSDSYRDGFSSSAWRESDGGVRDRRGHARAALLRVLRLRSHGGPRRAVASGPAGRDGPVHVLRRPGPQPDGRDGESGHGRVRPRVQRQRAAAQPHALRRLRQVLPERLPGRPRGRRHRSCRSPPTTTRSSARTSSTRPT